ncbi:AMP-binding protein [Paremcibacter congregatus]|uniref:AMP-binding protein n=1 Tax=Paremcibacter congregatus TaxID=2043170 RepID=UPI0030EC0F46
MSNANLYELFLSRFPTDRTKPFLQREDGRSLSYSDMDLLSARMVTVLKDNGLTKGTRLLVQVEKSMEAVCLYLACLRSGAVYLPLNTAYVSAEVTYFAEDARPALMVLPEDKIALFTAQSHRAMTMTDFMRAATTATPCPELAQVEKDDLAAILYTSGTTGRSKGAMLSHDNLASNALALHKIWHWQADDVLLHALPIFHVHGLFVALHCALLGGSTVWFLPSLDIDALIRLIPRSTVLMGVPAFYTRLLQHTDFNRDLCRAMRVFISGSAPLLSETFTRFEQVTGHRILERYGMSEAGMITSNPYEGDRVAGTVGFALPDVQLRICDDQGEMVPCGEIGTLEYKGPNLFQGYWEMPEKTAAEMRPDGYFISGDLAVSDTEGRISIVGRAKDLIISGGYNIYPKEIETALDKIPGILESAVIGAPHPDLGEQVVAVVIRQPSTTIETRDIQGKLSEQLARFKQPRHIIFRDSLPRNTMGKVQKAMLREEITL